MSTTFRCHRRLGQLTGALTAAGVVIALTSAAASSAAASTAAPSTRTPVAAEPTQTFRFTGTAVDVRVPVDTVGVKFSAEGGGGGAGFAGVDMPSTPGGAGAIVTGLAKVIPGQLVVISVGGIGGTNDGLGGWGGSAGGGRGGQFSGIGGPGGGGGGASTITLSGSPVIIAGGGGGGGESAVFFVRGGPGGSGGPKGASTWTRVEPHGNSASTSITGTRPATPGSSAPAGITARARSITSSSGTPSHASSQTSSHTSATASVAPSGAPRASRRRARSAAAAISRRSRSLGVTCTTRSLPPPRAGLTGPAWPICPRPCQPGRLRPGVTMVAERARRMRGGCHSARQPAALRRRAVRLAGRYLRRPRG